jgi:hypothetical protein
MFREPKGSSAVHRRERAVALVALVAAAAAALPSLATASQQPRAVKLLASRIYDATGREGLGFDIRVSGSGRQVTVSAEDGYQFVCGPGADHGDQPNVVAATRSAMVTKSGTFAMSLPVRHDRPIKLTAWLLTSSTISGTLSWHSTDSDTRGCTATVSWTAELRPLSNYFAGTTSTGANVTFAVTDTSKPVLSGFSVGGVPATCPAGQGEGTGTSDISISDGYAGTVRNGHFAAKTEDSDGIAFTVSGTILGNTASGLVSEFDRDGCSYGNTPWTAQFVRRGI